MTALSDLIAKLEAAPEGSRELDAAIAQEAGWVFMGPWLMSEGYFINTDGERQELPAYTTSLDAALPGENIVSVMWTAEDWSALHDFGDDRPLVEGKGRTEALARRIAALKAHEPRE